MVSHGTQNQQKTFFLTTYHSSFMAHCWVLLAGCVKLVVVLEGCLAHFNFRVDNEYTRPRYDSKG
jgi:hypothetical protein